MITQESFLAEVKGKGGQFIPATWQSVVATAAAFKGLEVVKTSSATVRTGMAFANLAQNEDRETGSLPWGQWATDENGKDLYPYVITHNGELYFRLYLADTFKVESTFTANGESVSRDEVFAMMTKSARERTSDGPTLTFAVKARLLLRIGNTYA